MRHVPISQVSNYFSTMNVPYIKVGNLPAFGFEGRYKRPKEGPWGLISRKPGPAVAFCGHPLKPVSREWTTWKDKVS